MDRQQFEDRIAADPTNSEAYLAYGDFLFGQGDPRGQLISVQNELYDGGVHKIDAGPRRDELERAERALLDTHREALLGPLARYERGLDFQWRMGFIRQLSLIPDPDHSRAQVAHPITARNLAAVTMELLAHESCRLLEGLYIQPPRKSDLGALVELLARWPTPLSLQAFTIDGYTAGWSWDDPEFRTIIGNPTALLERHPQLDFLVLTGVTELERIPRMERLRQLKVLCSARHPVTVTAILDGDMPQLDNLELSFLRADIWPQESAEVWSQLLPRHSQLYSVTLHQPPPQVLEWLFSRGLPDELWHLHVNARLKHDDPGLPSPHAYDAAMERLLAIVDRCPELVRFTTPEYGVSAAVQHRLRAHPKWSS